VPNDKVEVSEMSTADTFGSFPVEFEMTSNNKHHRQRSANTEIDSALFSAGRKQPGSDSHSLFFRVSDGRLTDRIPKGTG